MLNSYIHTLICLPNVVSLGLGGMQAIEAAIDKMSKHHIRHIKAYDPREGKVSNEYTLFHL